MAGDKALTYEEFIALAKENYTKGGDAAVECWDKKVFDGYVKTFGTITRTKALWMFSQWMDEEKERKAMMFSEIW